MSSEQNSGESISVNSASEDYVPHPDAIRDCNTPDGCATLEGYVGELQGRGLDDEALAAVREQRQEMCAGVGSCTLFYGLQGRALKKVKEPVDYRDPQAALRAQTTGY